MAFNKLTQFFQYIINLLYGFVFCRLSMQELGTEAIQSYDILDKWKPYFSSKETVLCLYELLKLLAP